MNLTHSVLLGQTTPRAEFEFARINAPSDWLWPVLGFCLVAAVVAWVYRRDAAELRPSVARLLLALRLAAFAGLGIVYLEPQWRNEVEQTHPSRAVVLIDTSQSMALTEDGGATTEPGSKTRLREVTDLLDGSLLNTLREKHDVVVAHFDDELHRVATLPRAGKSPDAATSAIAASGPVDGRVQMAFYAMVVCAIVAIVALCCRVAMRHWSLSLTSFLAMLGVTAGAAFLATRTEKIDWLALAGLDQQTPALSATAANAEDKKDDPSATPKDWEQALTPGGSETRLGQALRQTIYDEAGQPLSGIVLITDGRQNAGLDPNAAVAAAIEAKTPVQVIGIGSDKQPINVRVSDFMAPARAFPGDSYAVTGYIQAHGLAGQAVTVELQSRATTSDLATPAPSRVEETQTVTLPADGEALPVRFQLKPEEVGRRTLRFEIKAPPGDLNPVDNAQEAEIEVVDRKTRVLLFAGGPTREYTFLRNQLNRDKSMRVDVLLQTAQDGISQDAEKILADFPSTRPEMFEYDAVVAFDPNWRKLRPEQVELLENWVAEQAGGLIAVAGPVYTEGWSQDPAMAKIRALYPVEMQRRYTTLSDARYGSKDPWPIEFTREGEAAEFLWLSDTAAAARQAWSQFRGVHGYFAVRGAKPGATVYGSYSDPRAATPDGAPVYLAGQFYGSGRVFYLGSGEMWRLRSVDDAYLERFYTKLIRHVSQGRLARGSNRGVLLVERDRYLVGNTVVVRAQLNDAQLQPLASPAVTLDVAAPDGSLQTVRLVADPARVGSFQGQFAVRQEGAYKLDLLVPQSQQERLTKRIQVRVPDLERENPERNDALLSEIAGATGGVYYVGLAAPFNRPAGEDLASQLKDKSRVVTLPLAPRKLWDNHWLLGWIAGALCLEWLVRRLSRLA
jgi:hypothetical protein